MLSEAEKAALRVEFNRYYFRIFDRCFDKCVGSIEKSPNDTEKRCLKNCVIKNNNAYIRVTEEFAKNNQEAIEELAKIS